MEQNIIKKGENIFSLFSYGSEEIKIDKDVFWIKVETNLRTILNSRFSSEYRREPKPFIDRISFACVYCGDSHKDERKKRGNLFAETMQYHCFNGDCKAHMSIYNFFDDQKLLDNFTSEEKIFMKNAAASSFDFKKIKSHESLETFLDKSILDLAIDRTFFMNTLHLREIKGTRAEEYMKKRFQKSLEKMAYDPVSKNIYIFNLTKDLSKIIGFQIKTFSKRNPYLTYKTSKMYEMLGLLKDELVESLEKLDKLSNLFGIFQIDMNKPVTVMEGPLDSFLFPNSVALCSAKNEFPFDLENTRFFYDNDATGKQYSLKMLNMGKSVFLWDKFIKENNLGIYSNNLKDLNDLIILIKTKKLKCKQLSDYFSSDKYDIIYI